MIQKLREPCFGRVAVLRSGDLVAPKQQPLYRAGALRADDWLKLGIAPGSSKGQNFTGSRALVAPSSLSSLVLGPDVSPDRRDLSLAHYRLQPAQQLGVKI
jgi:hypothetical protein